MTVLREGSQREAVQWVQCGQELHATHVWGPENGQPRLIWEKDFWVCPLRKSRHPVTVISMSNGHAQSFWRWHACSAANEFAEDDASTWLQLATVTQSFFHIHAFYRCSISSLWTRILLTLPIALMSTWRWMNGICHDTHMEDGDVQLSTLAQQPESQNVSVRHCRRTNLLPLAIVKSATPSSASVTVSAGLLQIWHRQVSNACIL